MRDKLEALLIGKQIFDIQILYNLVKPASKIADPIFYNKLQFSLQNELVLDGLF